MLSNPAGLVAEASGQIAVLTLTGLLRVDPSSGDRTGLSSTSVGSGPQLKTGAEDVTVVPEPPSSEPPALGDTSLALLGIALGAAGWLALPRGSSRHSAA